MELLLLNLFEGNVGFCIHSGWGRHWPHNSTRIALQFLLKIPVLGRGVNNCNVSPRIKDLRSQLCFLSLPPSITVVSEKDNSFNNNNKNFKYDATLCSRVAPQTMTYFLGANPASNGGGGGGFGYQSCLKTCACNYIVGAQLPVLAIWCRVSTEGRASDITSWCMHPIWPHSLCLLLFYSCYVLHSVTWSFPNSW